MSGLAGRVALGGAEFSIAAQRDGDAAIATIRAAADAGIRIVDSARAYATAGDPTHNEMLFATALAGRSDVLIATKGGHFRIDGSRWGMDNSPARLRTDAETSLRALGRDRLDLYYLHRADDRSVPIEDSVGALDDLLREGKIAAIGLSNIDVQQLEIASRITTISAVQNQLTLWDESGWDVVAWCESTSTTHFAYSPLGGTAGAGALGARLPALSRLAAERGISVHRLALRGLLAASPVMSVIAGARRVATARDSAAAEREAWDAAAAEALALDLAGPIR